MRLPDFDGSQLCAQVDQEIFFPERGSSISDTRAAQEICSRCHFIEKCREYALHNAVTGIWGGMTEGERVKTSRALGITRKVVAGIELFYSDTDEAIAARKSRANKKGRAQGAA